MAYAGIQTMLLSYKMQKADTEFHLASVTAKYTAKTRESDNLNEELQKAKNAVSYDDPNYAARLEYIDNQYSLKLADVADWEEKLQQEMNNDQVEIKQLDGYIESWTAALQTNVTKTHTYGPNASG